MLRFAITERNQAALPALDLAGDVAIGSGPGCAIRLPAQVARDPHVQIAGGAWRALAEVAIDGTPQAAGASGSIGAGVVLEIGAYQIAIAPAPAGVPASPPQRTESLARELVRGLLGSGGAPTLEVVRGAHAGAKRALPPPESVTVIGRGDEASWVIVDPALSRSHAEIRRGWDGVTVTDLGSKLGTRLDGVALAAPAPLHDGAELALGPLVLRFHDPAERHLRGTAPPRPAPRAPSRWPFVAFALLAGLAAAGAIWILAT